MVSWLGKEEPLSGEGLHQVHKTGTRHHRQALQVGRNCGRMCTQVREQDNDIEQQTTPQVPLSGTPTPKGRVTKAASLYTLRSWICECEGVKRENPLHADDLNLIDQIEL